MNASSALLPLGLALSLASPALDAQQKSTSPQPAVVTTSAGASLVSFSEGALLVQKTEEYGGGWIALWLLDERPGAGWCSVKGHTKDQTFVIALPEQTLLDQLEFDTAGVDKDERSAKDLLVEMSDTSATAGFSPIATVALHKRKDGQRFPVAAQVPGRWVRLTVKSNHGAADYVELMDFRATGKRLTETPFADVSGTYSSSYGDFHIKQEGTSISGCYEWRDTGFVDGGLEGRVMRLTWREDWKSPGSRKRGPAIMVFSPGAKEMFGIWWNEGQTDGAGKIWNGTKKSAAVGTCPQWTAGVKEQMTGQLEDSGRVRVYGINFDSDSDRIKDDSKPTLDKIVALLKAKPDWKLTIEGHTDSASTADHNQKLSERRAEAVRAYLVAAGIDAGRLTAAGLGAGKPVASNGDALGRAQNRRVELVKR